MSVNDDNIPAIEVQASDKHMLGMPLADFLARYWQKHALLIRAAMPDFALPLEPEDLAGLSCEPGTLSRLVRHQRKADHWDVRHGPFDEEAFASLPEQDWSLLVQDVDKWDADVAALLEHFAFMPSWRVDDIMVSYATPGGGVGPHVDQYDVFLLQGKGRRRWAINSDRDLLPEHRDDGDLKLLRHFEPDHDWLLQPGDMLYLPPGVAHHGTAEDACMTFSVGMRAPAISEMLVDCADFRAERLPESLRYGDRDLTAADHDPGLIDPVTLDRVSQALGGLATDMSRDALGLWFGSFITRYRAAQVPAPPDRKINDQQLQQALARGAMLLRNPWARLAWMPRGHTAILFTSGESLPCPPDLARALCRHRYLQLERQPGGGDLEALRQLINQGYLRLSAAGVSADG